MKKFLIATAAAGLILLGGQTATTEAATVESLDTATVETQEMGRWAHFRDKYILDRRERHRHRHYDDYDDYGPPPPPPPPPRYHHYDDYGPPPPPPPPRRRGIITTTTTTAPLLLLPLRRLAGEKVLIENKGLFRNSDGAFFVAEISAAEKIFQEVLIIIFMHDKLRPKLNKNFSQEWKEMKLKDTKPGQVVRIDSVGESNLKQRLMTMGLIPGTRVEILNSAPLGDPIALRLRSYNLAMRRDDAAQIEVSEVG